MNAPARFLTTPERLRLRVEDFVLLADGGAFDEYTKTELIEGEIYVMNAQWSRHARIKTDLAFELKLAMREIDPQMRVIVEVTVRASDRSMPEPDIVLTSWRGDRDVPSETVALVVEVADTTLSTDLGRKLAIYAAAGVPEYWVLDVEGGRAVLHHDPQGEGYRHRREVPIGEPLTAATIDGLIVATAGLH